MVAETVAAPGEPAVSLDEIQAYLGVGDDAPADVLLELAGVASDLVDGPDSLTGACFRQRIVVASGHTVECRVEPSTWAFRMPGGPGRGLGPPVLLAAAYGGPDGAVVLPVGELGEVWQQFGTWWWQPGTPAQDALGARGLGCSVRFDAASFNRHRGIVAVRYRSGDDTIPREISVAVKQQVSSLWDLRGAHLLPHEGKAMVNPMVRRLLSRFDQRDLHGGALG